MWTLFQSGKKRRPNRHIRLESLENRQLLAADVGSEPPAEYSAIQTVERLEVESVSLRINGQALQVADQSLVVLNAGDIVEVNEINYYAGQELDGVLAVEGYMHKLPASQAAGQLDYADGRFGDGEPMVLGSGTHAGLDGSWTVQEGWDRLTLTLVRYFGNSSQLETVANFRLQVGLPDFAIDQSLVDSIMETEFVVGQPADIRGSWSNLGEGRYHNYLELDVANLQTGNVDWVGVLVGNASDDAPVQGAIDNQNPNDIFAETWIPEAAGEYQFLIAVDPERTWNESDETNNRIRFRVTVTEQANEDLTNSVFAVDTRGTVARYDTESGEVNVIGKTGVKLRDIAISPSGDLYAVSKDKLFQVNGENGQATLIGKTNRKDLNALTFMNDGTLLAGTLKSSDLFAVDITTGQLSSLGDLGHTNIADITAEGNQLRMTTKNGKLLEVTIDEGRVTEVTQTAQVKTQIEGLATTPGGKHMAARGNQLWTIDQRGKLTDPINLGSHGLIRLAGLAALPV